VNENACLGNTNHMSGGMRRILIVVLSLAVGGCGAASASQQGIHGSHHRVFRIALSMSYVGNDWQIEAKKLVTAEAKTPPYNREVKLDTYVAGAQGAGGADVNSQIEQMQQMIASGYDAIVTFPISPTALDPVIKQACDRGVVVIAYDGAVTEPCAYNVHINQFQAGRFTAQWLANALHGKGNIVEANGVPGTSVDTERRAGAASVWKQHPGIHVIAQFPGLWDQANTQQGMARVLGADSNIQGVWAQVGYGAYLAFKAAGRKLVPMVGESSNGFRSAMASGQVNGISYGSPPYTGAYALKEAVAILQGHKMPKLMQVPLPLNTAKQLKRCTDVKTGCNVFPANKAPSTGFFDDFYERDLAPELCLSAAITGQPCPGKQAKPPIDHSFPSTATSRA
jgi:ribose transport system substrate-binding protein